MITVCDRDRTLAVLSREIVVPAFLLSLCALQVWGCHKNLPLLPLTARLQQLGELSQCVLSCCIVLTPSR